VHARTSCEAAVGRLRARVAARSRASLREDAEDNTQFYLPGDSQYGDVRGFADFPELPGQSLNPMFDVEQQ
jgi:hypothetical protein